MKHDLVAGVNGTFASHPVRVRGLKPEALLLKDKRIAVAPRAGAWIET